MQTTVQKGKHANKYHAMCNFSSFDKGALSKIFISMLISLLTINVFWGRTKKEKQCWCNPSMLNFSLCFGQNCLSLPFPLCKFIFPDRFLLSGIPPPSGSSRRDWRWNFGALHKTARINDANENHWGSYGLGTITFTECNSGIIRITYSCLFKS